MSDKVKMGDEVKCSVTKFQGVITSWTKYLHGMDQVGIQPPCGKDGKIPEGMNIDLTVVRLVKAGAVKPHSVTDSDEVEVQLGDKAEDSVTGLRGTVTSYTSWINGCSRLGLTPGLDKKGKVQETEYFAGPRLKLTKRPKIQKEKEEKPKSGGPMTVMRY